VIAVLYLASSPTLPKEEKLNPVECGPWQIW